MYRKCDNCQSIFRINKVLQTRFEKNEGMILYCPFCYDKSNHEIKLDRLSHAERMYIKDIKQVDEI